MLARQPANRQLAYIYLGMAMGAVFGVRTGQLEAASRRALDLAATLHDEPLAGWASYQRAWWAFNTGRLAESLSLHERMYDIAVRLDDAGIGAWAAFGRAMLNGMYLADPLTAARWCARGLARPHLDALPRQRDSLLDHLGQAKGSSGELAEARQIAATLDRARSWNGCCSTGQDTGNGPKQPGWQPGSAMSAPVTASTASSTPTGSAGCGACSEGTRRPDPCWPRAWRSLCTDPSFPPR